MDVVKPVLKYTSLSHGRPIICLAGGYGWTKLSNLQLRQVLVHGQALTSIHRNFSFPVNPILLSRRCGGDGDLDYNNRSELVTDRFRGLLRVDAVLVSVVWWERT